VLRRQEGSLAELPEPIEQEFSSLQVVDNAELPCAALDVNHIRWQSLCQLLTSVDFNPSTRNVSSSDLSFASKILETLQ
jgi:hypothetical protein